MEDIADLQVACCAILG